MKMKMILSFIFMILSIWSIAQPTGDIEKDTAQANQYFKKGLRLFKENRKNKEVFQLFKDAVALYEAYPFSKGLVRCRSRLALQFYIESDYEKTKTFAEETIRLVKEKAPDLKNDDSLIGSYIALAQVFVSNPDKNIEYYLKGLDCAKKIPSEYFNLVKSLIKAYMNHSKLEDLKALLTDVEVLLSKQEDDKLDQYWLIYYYGKVMLYSRIRNYEQAVLYSKKLFADNEKYNLFPTFRLAGMYMQMGIFLTRLGEYDEAIKWAEKGTASAQLQGGGQSGTHFNSLGYIYAIQKKYQKSIETYEKAIELFQQDSVSVFKMWIANAYDSMASSYGKLKKYDKAIECIEKSKRYGPKTIQNYRLGVILGKQEKYEAAIKNLHQALVQYSTYFKDENIDKNPSVYEVFKSPGGMASLSLKGQLEYKWGKTNKNKDRLLKSYETLKIAFSHYETTARANKGFDKSRFLLNRNLISVLGYMIMIHTELYKLEPKPVIFNEILYLSERRKALQLIETLSPSSLPPSVVKEEQALLKEISDNGQKLDLATYSNQKDSIRFYNNALFKTNQVLEKHLESIKKDYPKISNDFYNDEYATLQDVQNQITTNTLLVEYTKVANLGSFAITIGKDKQKNILIDLSTVSANIKKLNQLLQDPFAFQNGVRNEFIDVSHKLYKTLIKPIESELEGKTELMVVVEGQLFNLPFELLLKSNEKKPYHQLDFLIKKYAINYHYSATAFLKLQEKKTVQDNSLLAFAPVFSKGEVLNEATRSLDFMIDSLYSSIEGEEFTALPNTKKEVKHIAKLVKLNDGQTKVLLQKNATKAKFSQALESQSYQFVHIATHGLVNFKNPRLSALACYAKNETMDNLIYANEIQFKDINADLVILSSCESGIGQLVEGEGLIALNRSFIYSGAKNVLFSLWKVSDEHSSDLMIDFYKNYYQGQSYTEALRSAKLNMLANPTSAQPKFWSAFVLMGQ